MSSIRANLKQLKTVQVEPKKSERRTRDGFDLGSYTWLERKQFTINGLYPIATKDRRSRFLHKLRLVITFITGSTLAVPMVISLAIEVTLVPDIIEIMYYLITQTAYLFKLVNFVRNGHMLPATEAHLNNPIVYKYYHLFGSEGLDEISKTMNRVASFFRFCVTMAMIMYLLVPLVGTTHVLPLAGWYPVDKMDYRGVLFTIQMISLLISAYTNISMDIFTSHYISVAVGELRLLKLCLMNVDYTLEDDGERRQMSPEEARDIEEKVVKIEGDREYPKLPPSALDDLVFLHKHAIALVYMIEGTWSYGIFVQFLASMAVICLSGFQMLLVPANSLDFQLYLFYCLSMFFQMSVYCYFGNEVIFESSNMSEACYMSNWYEGKQKYKKVLFIMMERTKQQIALSAGKFFFLSLTTFVLIMKTSYSYFAVLRRMYQDYKN